MRASGFVQPIWSFQKPLHPLPKGNQARDSQMRRTLTAVLITATVLGGCGSIRESRLNPFNWFQRSQDSQMMAAVAEAPADPRSLVADVVDLTVEPYPGGAIIRARGLPPTQGYWDAELVARPLDENGVQVFDFYVFPPVIQMAANIPQSREINVATTLTDIKMENITQIVVQGANNARSSRR